jgi:uncharacterized heparinase superfamily protein
MGRLPGKDALRLTVARACEVGADIGAASFRLIRAGWDAEWRGTPLHRALLSRPIPDAIAAKPRDYRPADPALGRSILRGDFNLGGSALQVGADGDPWDRPSPTYRLAVAMHRYEWIAPLLLERELGAVQALRLHLQWRRLFGAWNTFSWSAAVLERRVFNLACSIGPMAAGASDAEIAGLTLDLARQARHLLKVSDHPERAAQRAAVAAVAACALAGVAGEKLGRAAVARLELLLPRTVLADGAHASRSPEAGLEFLFDLLTLDDAMSQRGLEPPAAMTVAIDRLSAALRFFSLGDGRLACFQGGEAATTSRVAAARAQDVSPTRPPEIAPNGGYHRLSGVGIMAMVDGGAPAGGVYSVQACAQPFALEVVCGRDRLITNCGWSPDGGAPQAFRLADGASTLAVADSSVGEPLSGLMAAFLGPRLAGAPRAIMSRRHEGPEGVWLDLAHDGWGRRFGLRHARRLFLDRANDQLRGEDKLEPLPGVRSGKAEARARYLPFTVRFHLHPDANASLARDQKSVLIRGASNQGWWLRSDAPEVSIEPSAHFEHGAARRTSQVVLRGRARSDTGGRVRWKLAMADS